MYKLVYECSDIFKLLSTQRFLSIFECKTHSKSLSFSTFEYKFRMKLIIIKRCFDLLMFSLKYCSYKTFAIFAICTNQV